MYVSITFALCALIQPPNKVIAKVAPRRLEQLERGKLMALLRLLLSDLYVLGHSSQRGFQPAMLATIR